MTLGSDDLTNINLLFYGPSYTYPQSFRSMGPTISKKIGEETISKELHATYLLVGYSTEVLTPSRSNILR